MRERRAADLAEDFDKLVNLGSLAGLDDEALLTRFREARDARAFAAIVERHGPLVLRVCRDFLPHEHDVQDAFQATFLVLIRKNPTIRRPGALASWLHGVSRRVSKRIKRQHRTLRLVADVATAAPSCPVEVRDELQLVHKAIDRLPEKYRLPVVLFYLEGLTQEETAARLRWPVGSVRGRLARARERLRRDLERSGVSAGLFGPGPLSWPCRLEVVLSRPLIESALSLLLQPVRTRIATVAQGVIQAMLVEKYTSTVIVIAAAVLVTVGSSTMGGFGGRERDQPARKERAIVAAASPDQSAESKEKVDPSLIAEAKRERAEKALDRKKVQAEMLELEVEGLRERIRSLSRQESMMSGPLGLMGGRTVPEKAAEQLQEARDRFRAYLDETRKGFEMRSLELSGLKREIASGSQALGHIQITPNDASPSVENRLRSLEQKVDRILEAIEKNAR